MTPRAEPAAPPAAPGGALPLLTAEELLAGAELEHEVEIPRELLPAAGEGEAADGASAGGNGAPAGADGTPAGADGAPGRADAPPVGRVRVRPLCLRDVHLIAKAATGDEVLTSVLMIQRAVVEPELDQRTISRMPSGLVRFLVDRINRISGLTSSDDEIREMAGTPIVQAFFVLAKEFGWTPEEIRGLTVGQVLGYLEMLDRSGRAAG